MEWCFFLLTDVDKRRDYQCIQGTFVRGSSLSVVCTALGFILKFYVLSYTLQSVAVKCNAVHSSLIAPYSYNFMSVKFILGPQTALKDDTKGKPSKQHKSKVGLSYCMLY